GGHFLAAVRDLAGEPGDAGLRQTVPQNRDAGPKPREPPGGGAPDHAAAARPAGLALRESCAELASSRPSACARAGTPLSHGTGPHGSRLALPAVFARESLGRDDSRRRAVEDSDGAALHGARF